MEGGLLMSVPYAKVIPMTNKKDMSLSEHWNWIYLTFPDNAFDYVGKPIVNDVEGTLVFEGRKYAEVPF
jgi:hypothetical protein